MVARAYKFVILFLAGFLSFEGDAASLSLVWDPSPSPEAIGYVLHCSLRDSPVQTDFNVGKTTRAFIDNLAERQTYAFSVTAYNTLWIQSEPSNVLLYTAPAVVGNPSHFVKSDSTTRGNWQGVYGSRGHVLAGAAVARPSYVTIATPGSLWTWSETSPSLSALQIPDDSMSRIAACWYSSTQLGFDFDVADRQTYLVSIYFYDGSSSDREERVDLIDRVTGATLDSRTVSGFSAGIYLTYQISGQVSVRVNPLRVNAVASAIFFDGGTYPPPAGTSAEFIKTDTTTQGNWRGVYGSDGYWMAADTATLPQYAAVTTAAPSWVWPALLTTPSALVLPGASNRVAACWYSFIQLGFDLSLNDHQSHHVSVYFFDPSLSSSQQRVEIVDRATGTVLDSRDLLSLSYGTYLTWDIRGDVSLRVTPSIFNAVASGIFFDAGGSATSLCVTGLSEAPGGGH